MDKLIRDKSGAISIWFLILSLVIIVVISGYVTMYQKNYVFTEIRSVMDVAGTSALKAGVDEVALRTEEFVINESIVREKFRELVNKSIKDSTAITSFKIATLNIDVFESNWGTGVTNSTRPQARLEAIAKLRIKMNSELDNFLMSEETYFDSYNNQTFTIEYAGRTKDGEIEIIVRSVTRLIYR